MTKKITLEDLAVMIAEGFNAIENRFVGVDQRFISIDQRFVGVEGRLNDLTQEVRQFKKETTDNFERIDLRLQQVAYQSDYRELDQRVTTLERRAGVR